MRLIRWLQRLTLFLFFPVASIVPLTKPCAGRPPVDGGPPLTTYAPDPDGPDENYLVNRARRAVDQIERDALSSECDAADILPVIENLQQWIEFLLSRERSVSPTILPPGVGILYALDDVLEPETEAVQAYLRLIERLDQIKGPIEKELSFRKLFEGWGPSLE